MRQNLVAQFIQVLKHWLWDMHSGLVVEKNLALSVDHCQLQALQFLVRVINLLSIPLRCNGFSRIQKALVGQTDSRPSNSDHDLIVVQVWLWKCSGASSQSSHRAHHCCLSYTIHFLMHVTMQLRNVCVE